MAYNYLDEKQLKDALVESEAYMRDFWKNIPELQRITRGKPGKVPKGKPRVTDGTLASIRRDKPAQVIQQLPTGKVVIKDNPDMESKASGILTDVILPHANSGGTPFDKAIMGIEDAYDVGSAWALCFFNRTGSLLHADYKLISYNHVLFEKGKVSEFDQNFMPVVEYYTKYDLKAIMERDKQLKGYKADRNEEYKGEWDMKLLQELIDNGESEKDAENLSEEEKKKSAQVGYFKIVKFLQRGEGATFYYYAPKIDKVVGQCVNEDPRGIMPLHGFVAKPDRYNPLGEPLAAISAGKQNLADFDMQMYQYGQGMAYSPATKLWGNTPESKIKIAPDAVIKLNGTRATDDFEAVNLNNQAIANFTNNASYIKTQIYNEQGGSSDSSVSADAGSVGFSKTSAGVNQQQARMNATENVLRKRHELWQGRIFETLLNLHFAHSSGVKEIDYSKDTMKRLKLQDNQVNYDTETGPITFTVDASTSEAADANTENEKLSQLLEIRSKYGAQPDDKMMLMYNQIVTNAGVDDPEKLMYSDEEIQGAEAMRNEQIQMAHASAKAQLQQAINAAQPQQPAQQPPKTLGEALSWSPADLTPEERAQALAQVGIQADTSGAPTANQATQASDTAIKVDKHATDTALAQAKLEHEQRTQAMSHAMDFQKTAHSQALAEHAATQPKPVGAAK